MNYHSLPGVRASSLKTLAKKSPRHFRHAQDTQGDGSDDTASRRFLRAVHCAVLEPGQFAAGYEVYDDTRRGKIYDLWQQSRPGVQALTLREEAVIRAIVSSLRAHEDAARILFEHGWSEVVREWIDLPSGVACKAQIDRVVRVEAGGCEIWDMKTLDSTHPDAVRWHIRKRRYDLQLAHYRAGVSGCVGAGLIVVEERPPHDVAVYRLTEADLQAAEEQRQELLQLVAECQASDSWPGCCPTATTLAMDPEELGDIDTDDEEI